MKATTRTNGLNHHLAFRNAAQMNKEDSNIHINPHSLSPNQETPSYPTYSAYQ